MTIPDATPKNSSNTNAYELAARELLRAVRGRRSQVALARRLGYRSNPITDWERGARHPSASEVLRAATRCGLPVEQAFARWVPLPPPPYVDPKGTEPKREDARRGGTWQLGPWMDALRGEMPIGELARRLGRSRYSVGRWLAGRTQPLMYEFLELLDAITGRSHDWVAELVPIEQVPSLLPAYKRARAARTIAFEQPWTEAILRVLETTRYRENPEVAHATLAAWLGISEATFDAALTGLTEAGVIELRDGRYEVITQLSVDTRAGDGSLRHLQRHWLSVALERAAAEQNDWFAYNVISCSEADLQRIEDCLRRAYLESRAIVAASEPSERAALVLMQLAKW